METFPYTLCKENLCVVICEIIKYIYTLYSYNLYVPLINAAIFAVFFQKQFLYLRKIFIMDFPL